MLIPGRTHSSPAYRYGFQGQEKDDEIKGEGNSLNYTFRMHDPRVGRFFAVDPLTKSYPWNSPYAFSENRVIDGVEMEGAEVTLFQLKMMYWQAKAYVHSLKVKGQEGVKEMYSGATKSTHHINDNVTYSQQKKDNLHNVQKFTGAVKVASVAVDPPMQVLKAVTPIDDAITLTTGLKHDIAEVREATVTEKVFAGVEIVGFIAGAGAYAQPTKTIVTETVEQGVTKSAAPVISKIDDVAKTPPLRAAYEGKVKDLSNLVNNMRSAGKTSEEIARTVHAERRALGVEYKDLTPPDLLKKIYKRNLEKYGDELGPTIEFLRDKGKSWDDIIESATRPGGKDINFNSSTGTN